MRGIVVAAVLAVVLAGCGQARAGSAPDLGWTSCPGAPQGHPVECATVQVPVDWATGDGRVGLHAARLSAADAAKRIGVLLFNPGGPGTGAAGYLSTPGARHRSMATGPSAPPGSPRSGWTSR